jgi:hypothetical protein
MIWKRIGFKKSKLNNRNDEFYKALSAILDDLKEGEYELEERIEDSIKEYKNRVVDLIRRLNLDFNKLNIKNDETMSLVEEEKFYIEILKKIEKIKMDRKAKLNDLKSKEHELCDLLNENSYSITDGKFFFFNRFNF